MKLLFWKKGIVLTPDEKKRLTKERLLLILSGILLGISFPPFPFPFQLFMLVGLVPFFYVLENRKTLIEKNRATYLTFFTLSVITLYWVGSWQKNADPFLMISGGLLLFVNPLFFLIPTTLLYLSRKVLPYKITIFFFPLFWVTYEYLYMLTDLSFPWLTLGNGLADFTLFIQAADIVGAVGLSAIVVYINVFIYLSFINLKKNKRKFILNGAIAISIFVIILAYGAYRISTFKISDDKVKIGLIQPNLDPWEKWSGGNLDTLTNFYLNLSQKAVNDSAKIIFWPETALPVFLLDGQYTSLLNNIYDFLRKNNVYLITGMPNVIYYYDKNKIPDDAKKIKSGDYYYATYNAILMLSPNSRNVETYGKMKLVPFGERVPFVDQLPFLGDLLKWGVGISGWNVGKDTTVFKIPNNFISEDEDSIKINGLVCYESIYPYLVSAFVRKGAEVITVVTNDSWYGNSSGPYQHKEISVLRAVENRRTVARAANGGISCIIDPDGRTKIESKMFTKTVLTGDVYLQHEETFFTKYPFIIPILSSVLSLWIFGIAILKKLKEKFNL